MLQNYNKKIILQDGTQYYGYSFGSTTSKVLEIVFNTSMVGYTEILSDPSYTYQAVVMTYPLIGNYGVCLEDFETISPSLGAFIVDTYNDKPSNFRSNSKLSDILALHDISGISGIDTRQLTRHIRSNGSMKVLICDLNVSLEEGLAIIEKTDIDLDAVSQVSTKKIAFYRAPNQREHTVVVIDCGCKLNIIRSMQKKGCDVIVVPFDTSAEDIMSYNPDGVFISNGPGDPRDVLVTIETIQKLHGKVAIFGICLGHQIIALSYGAKCYKLKFGHRGSNHPVKNLNTDKIEITSQNHSYAVDTDSLASTPLKITHVNLLDNTVEGISCQSDKVFSVQYHPESSPGPQDSQYLFDEFIKLMRGDNANA